MTLSARPFPGPNLSGRRILLPTRMVGSLVADIEELGGEVDQIDLIQREPFASPELDRLHERTQAGECDWLIITSPYTPIALAELGFPLPTLDAPGVRFAAVGEASAEAVEREIGRVDLSPASGIGGAALAKVFPAGSGLVVIPGAETLSRALPPALTALGWRVEHVGVYRTTSVSHVPEAIRSRWQSRHYDALIVTSASVARAAADLLGTTGRVVALGDPSAEAARQAGFTDVVIARDATAEAICEALL